MTGTEERAAQEALRLIRGGMEYSKALAEVRAAFNLSTHGVSRVANAIAQHVSET